VEGRRQAGEECPESVPAQDGGTKIAAAERRARGGGKRKKRLLSSVCWGREAQKVLSWTTGKAGVGRFLAREIAGGGREGQKKTQWQSREEFFSGSRGKKKMGRSKRSAIRTDNFGGGPFAK